MLMRVRCSTVETRQEPQCRTEDFVRVANIVAKTTGRPFLGHKIPPLPSRWPEFNFYRYNPGEVMHGIT